MFLPGYPSTAASPLCAVTFCSLTLPPPPVSAARQRRASQQWQCCPPAWPAPFSGRDLPCRWWSRWEAHVYRLVKCWKKPADCTLCMFLHTEDSRKPASPASSPAQSPSHATPVSLPDCDPRNASCLLKRSLDAQVTIEVAKEKPWRTLVHNFPPCALWSWGSLVPPHALHSACVLARMVLVLQKQQFLDLHNTQKTYFLFMGTHCGPSEVTLWYTFSSCGFWLSMSPFVNSVAREGMTSVAAPWILLLLSEKGLWQSGYLSLTNIRKQENFPYVKRKRGPGHQ